jgi:hypothetical protein
MHAVIEPVQISGLSGSGTATQLHVVLVAETKGKDVGHARVSYDVTNDDNLTLAQGNVQMSDADYAAGKASDEEVAGWLAALLGFQSQSVVSDPAPVRTVDEVQEPEQPGA